MKSRVTLGLLLGGVAIAISLLIPPTTFGSTDLKIVLGAGGATLLVGVGIGVLIYGPVIRSLTYFRSNRADSFSWIGQRGPEFAQSLAKIVAVNPASVPGHMILLSNEGSLEIWRAFPRESIARIARDRIEGVGIEAGHPRARLVFYIEASDGSPARLELIPSSDRSGVFPASPAELEQIRERVLEASN